MAGFKFQFAAVLKQKQIQEDTCQRDLAKLMRRKMIYEDQLRQIQRTLTDSKDELTGTLSGRVDMNRVGQFARYSGETTVRAHQIVRGLAELEGQISRSRDGLRVAMRERKAIELLREKQEKQWKQAMTKRQNAELDEMALQSFVRKASAEVN